MIWAVKNYFGPIEGQGISHSTSPQIQTIIWFIEIVDMDNNSKENLVLDFKFFELMSVPSILIRCVELKYSLKVHRAFHMRHLFILLFFIGFEFVLLPT